MEERPAKARSRQGVGVRALKNHTSAVLRRVQRGESVTITDRNRPVALLMPVQAADPEAIVQQLVSTGRLAYSGGKPQGCKRPPKLAGVSVAAAVLEDRR